MQWQFIHIRPDYPRTDSSPVITTDLEKGLAGLPGVQESISRDSLTGVVCTKTRIEYLMQSIPKADSSPVLLLIQCRLQIEAGRVYLLAADSLNEALDFTAVDLNGLLGYLAQNTTEAAVFLEARPVPGTDIEVALDLLTGAVTGNNLHLFICGDGKTEPAFSRRLDLGSVFLQSLLTACVTEESAGSYPLPRPVEPLKLLQELRKAADDFHKDLESSPRPVYLVRGEGRILLPAWPPLEPVTGSTGDGAGFDDFNVERIEFYFHEYRRLKRYADYNSLRHKNLPTGGGRALFELVKPALLKKQGTLKRTLPVRYSSLELSEEQRLYLQADDHFWRWQAKLTDGQNCQEQTVWSLTKNTDLSDTSWANIGQKFQVCFMVWQGQSQTAGLDDMLAEHFTLLDDIPDLDLDEGIEFETAYLSGDRAWQLLPSADGLGIYSMLGAKPWPDFLRFAKTLTEYIEV